MLKPERGNWLVTTIKKEIVVRNAKIQLIWLHLIVASFSIPFIIMVAVSGGLYLAGIKGSTASEEVDLPGKVVLDFKSPGLELDVRKIISGIDENYEFEQIRAGSRSLQTRPTSRTYYVFERKDSGLSVVRHRPDFQKTLIELHKGHGPRLFKIYQQLVAAGFIFILVSGVATGLLNRKFRNKTLLMLMLGWVVFLGLALS